HRDLTPRMRDHLGSLSGPLVCDPFLIQKLMGILKKVNEDAHIDRSMEPEWVVLEAVLVLMHNGRRLSSVLAGQIASLITNVLRRRGETQAMSPRSVGAVLKSIGIKTTRVGSRGRGVILTNRRCEEIHAFAHRFELRWTDIAETAQAVGLSAASCKLCLESGLTEGIRADRIEPSECT